MARFTPRLGMETPVLAGLVQLAYEIMGNHPKDCGS
jgi:hypothetical protein